MDVNGGTHAFGRYVGPSQRLANDRVARGVLERRLGIEFEVESAAADQAGKTDAGAVGLRPHLTVGGDEIVGTHVEALRRKANQRLACGCRGLPDLHAAALDTIRAGRPTL